ncbi:MAG: AMP-binding protein, partial [Clostridia bacterium]|nr:AMP-binding protein [Clostridia bacterium]
MEKQSLKPSVAKPWLQFFTKEAIESEIPQDILYNIVKNNNEGYHSNIALNYLDNRITYGEFFKNVEAAAASFEALGVKKGDTVICASITIPEMAYTLYALNKIGATMFAVDPRMTAQFLEDKVKESKAKVVLYVDVFHDKFAEMLPTLDVAKVVTISICDSMPFIKKMVVKSKLPKVEFTDKIVNWKTFLSYGKGKTSSVCKYGDNDVAAITLTGGTTGTPKGVMLTNDGFNAVMHSFFHCGVPYVREQRFFNIIPAFSSYGIVASLHMPLSLG